MKRIFIFLFATLALSYVQAQTSGKCGDNLTWSLDEGTGVLTIAGEGAMYNYAFSSNSRAPWYSIWESIKEVKITGSPTNIGNYAFLYCSNLISIEIPESVTSIGGSAFYDCTSLTSVTIPSGVTSFGSAAFYNCTSLASITIPFGVTSIGSSAFQNCKSFRNIEIPSSVTSIGSSAFPSCTSISSIISNIPADKLCVPGSSAFYNIDKEKCILAVPAGAKSTYAATAEWKDFTNIVEYNGKCGSNLYWSFNSTTGMLYILGSGSMYNYNDGDNLAPWNSYKTKIKSVVIKSDVTGIGSYAFLGCSSLCSIISEAPSAIVCGSNAFDGVSNCVLAVPSGLKSAFSAASEWKNLSTIVEYNGKCGLNLYWSIDTSGTFYIMGYGAMYNYSNNTAIPPFLPWYYSRTSIKDVRFCGNITSLGQRAFLGCSSLTSVTIPSGVTSIGDYAFSGCTSLTSVSIPSSVTILGNDAFSNCTSFTSVTIPSGVTSIGNRAFSCTSLTSVTIPSGVTSIGQSAFSNCMSLSSIISNIPSDKLFVPGSSAFYNIDKAACTLYVSAGAKSTYAATALWKDFTNIVEYDGKCGSNLYWSFNNTTVQPEM